MGRRHRRRTRTSSHVVLNNNDLLTLILLRVPWRKLVSLKCVSRRWLSLITAPHFISLRNLPPLRASGLFFQYKTKAYFVHLDDPNTPSLAFAHDPFVAESISIVHSCNGLLLCGTARFPPVAVHKRDYYVYNPSTNQVDTLPKHPCRHDHCGCPCMDLIFDPSKSLHYKVISFHTGPLSSDLYIYSSETGTWRVSIKSYLPAWKICFTSGVYWNGCMHWLSLYSKSPDGLYFNVDEERLVTFRRPPNRVWPIGHSYFGESEDHLHYTRVRPYDSSFSIYEMKSDYSEWFVKYQIDLVPIWKVFPIMRDCSFNAAVLSIITRENFKEDSFLILEIPGKIIRYNLVDRSFIVIWDSVVDLESQGNLRNWSCGFEALPYIEWPNQ